MNEVKVTFIGGPWDGHRKVFKASELGDQYTVAHYEPYRLTPSDWRGLKEHDTVLCEYMRYVYAIRPVGRDNFVAVLKELL